MSDNKVKIGDYVKQPGGFNAFIPCAFPPKPEIEISQKIMALQSNALLLLGKLNGITKLLPDKDCFLKMFIRKDASSSSQIEGTNATIMDAIEKENIEPGSYLPPDVDDILHYIQALNYGMERSKTFPISLRFVRELHKELMIGARKTQFAYPGEFRITQNWIGGTKPDNARFVPPPPENMKKALYDLENFMCKDNSYLPLIKAGLLHAQFETIHPFNDGNGRTGRMLITMFLLANGLIEVPVLYLSSFFKKHQKVYYEKLNGYHNGEISDWLEFFLDGIIETAQSAIDTCDGIIRLREYNSKQIQKLNRTASESTMKVIENLYKIPIVGIADVLKWSELSKPNAYKLIKRLEAIGVLYPVKQGDNEYGQKWGYRDYLRLFETVAEN